jgi:hypothetical protein
MAWTSRARIAAGFVGVVFAYQGITRAACALRQSAKWWCGGCGES